MTPRSPSILRRALRALGPAVPAVPLREAGRAGLGAALGLGLAGLLAASPLGAGFGLALIAPFGASAVLLFAVPNSPLAQPWSALAGNGLGALAGLAACLLLADPVPRVAVAVGLAVVVTSLARAVHPPAGAVAMTAALAPDATLDLGTRFALVPVGLGTAILVLAAVAYARATGRRYPFRHVADPGPHGTADPAPPERLGLDEAELAQILARHRLGLNLGAEDLARLIGAAELQAATHGAGGRTAAAIMSRDLVTVGPEAPLPEVAALVLRHRVAAIPVVAAGDRLLGLVLQRHLIGPGIEPPPGLLRRLGLAGGRGGAPARAGDVMATGVPVVAPDTPLGALLPLLAADEPEAVPVVAGGRLVGLVTRTDLIAALAREGLRPGAPD